MFLSPGSRARPNSLLTHSSNTWRGTQVVNGNEYFKSGQPWTDIRAWGASPSKASNATEIQNAINYMYTTYGGGVVYCPPGNYIITSGVTVKGGVRVVGAGRNITYINGFASNVNAVTFDATCTRGCGLEHLTVQGFGSTAAGSNAVVIAQNIPVNLFDINAWYGSAGLYTQGIDGTYLNCWFIGCVDGVVSNGANWYIRSIIDSNGSFASYQYGFYQGNSYAGATSQENHFEQCDFSGPFTNSIRIDDVSSNTFPVTYFHGCVTSAPIVINNAYFTSFVSNEFGSSIVTLAGTGGTCSVVGSVGFGTSLSLTSSQFTKAANFNIA